MSGEYRLQMEPMRLTGDYVQPIELAWDAGSYNTLSVAVRILKSGSGGTLVLEHAASLREEAFKPISGISQSLSSVEDLYYLFVGDFLRYVRCRATGVGGNPVVGCEIIGKN